MSAKRGNRRKAIYDEEMRTIVQDLQYSVRQLVRSPGLALTALVSLALGIGATTAVFSVIYAGLINPYPFTAADRIVRLTMQSKAGQADWINLNGDQPWAPLARRTRGSCLRHFVSGYRISKALREEGRVAKSRGQVLDKLDNFHLLLNITQSRCKSMSEREIA